MSILSDTEIIERCAKGMITPYETESVKTMETSKGVQKILSYGVSSYGYDMVLSSKELKIFTNINTLLVDPRKVDPRSYMEPDVLIDEDGLEYVILPPNSTMLGHTKEYFKIPRDIFVVCVGKSTLARVGISILVTPLEPEWEGNLVVEIVNCLPSPVKIYPNQGIGQLVFFKTDTPCAVSYGDRAGKYQGQCGTFDARV